MHDDVHVCIEMYWPFAPLHAGWIVMQYAAHVTPGPESCGRASAVFADELQAARQATTSARMRIR